MNKNLIALFAATALTTSAFADISITGEYEGIIQDGNPGAATYEQDLDLNIVGSAEAGKATIKLENKTGSDSLVVQESYVEAGIEGLDFKGGKFKTRNGHGLFQKKAPAANQMELSASVGNFGVTVGQASGNGNATLDTSFTVGGIDVKVQNITNSDRFVTASTSAAGVDLDGEYQKTSVGTNMGGTVSTDVGGLGVAGVLIDVEDTAGITQDDGILGDISDANSGSTVKALVLTTDSTLGGVTGKLINKNDKNTYVAALEYEYSKTEDADGIIKATITLTF